MSAYVRVRDFDAWWRRTLERSNPIRVAGEFRSAGRQQSLDLLELNSAAAHTVKVLVPARPPIVNAPQLTTSTFVASAERADWWNTWGPVLVSAGLISPIIDPVRLLDLLHDSRRIRFCCDTNALAGGVVSWLLMALGERVDLVTSAVVDREIAAWPERTGSGFWQAKDSNAWQLRTIYRLARRIIESPPDGVVVDRLSPEQGALMLAKYRDEQAAVKKSPDADVLLIEVARALVREQSRNVRVVFLTGDRNNARTATGALGAENVLFAVADDRKARVQQGKVLARGFYRPDGPLGAVNVPSITSLIWSLLAPCDRLQIKQSGGCWSIACANSVDRGVPSDWAEPWLKIEEVTRAASSNEVVTPPPPVQQAEEAPIRDVEVSHVQETAQAAPRDTSDWLLPPRPVGASIDIPKSVRPRVNTIYKVLVCAFGIVGEGGAEKPDEGTLRVLEALGATDSDGKPGPRVDEFERAWKEQDYDWFHAEMLRLPGYAAICDKLRTDGSAPLTSPEEGHSGIARSLGQIARLDRKGGLVVGDAPVRVSDFVSALERWFPTPRMTLGTAELCNLAARELHLTPFRFEQAMERYWRIESRRYSGQTGGTVEPGVIERVVLMGTTESRFRSVGPGDLSFGRSGPVRFIMRTE